MTDNFNNSALDDASLTLVMRKISEAFKTDDKAVESYLRTMIQINPQISAKELLALTAASIDSYIEAVNSEMLF